MAGELLLSRRDPEVLAAALKIASGYASVAHLDECLAHPVWYVRMQAAALLGRMGRTEGTGRLEKLLTDQEWWVRHRAAKALVVRIKALSRSDLEQFQSRLRDPYAYDALEQALAEAGMR
jgi:HEAT repeat protein